MATMTEQAHVTLDPALRQYVDAVRDLWQTGNATDPAPAEAVRREMQTWIRATPATTTDWLQDLVAHERDRVSLWADPDCGFVQLAHFHAPGRSNTPHDHGPHWVVYGVYQGEVDIPVYAPTADGTQVRRLRTDHLKPGDAVAYYPGEFHSTEVMSGDPAVVLRFLSQDLSQVPRTRFRRDQII